MPTRLNAHQFLFEGSGLPAAGYWFPLVGKARIKYWLSSDVSQSGRIVQASINTEGKIVLRFPTAYDLSAWSETVTPLTGSRGVVRYRYASPNRAIVLVYETSSGIQRSATIDEGETFNVATTITSSGAFPALFISKTGNEVYAWRDPAGSIKVRVLSAQGTDLLPGASPAVVTAVASDVAESALSVTGRIDGQTYVLSYRNTANAIVNVISTDGGVTWA